MSSSGVWGRFGRAWNAFFFGCGNTFTLGLFRILFAYCLWQEIGTTSARSLFAVEGGFHLPYVSFIQPVSRELYDWIHLTEYPLVVLLGIGLFSRFAAAGLLALQGYVFFADQLNFGDHPYFYMLILLFLIFSPADDALSIRRLFRGRGNRDTDPRAYLGGWKPLTSQRLIQVQLCIVYFFAATHKLNVDYLSGRFLSRLLRDDLFDDRSGEVLRVFLSPDNLDGLRSLLEQPAWLILPAILTVAVEFFLPFALWSRRWRPYAFILGFGLHASIALIMDIKIFSIAALATYILFLPPEALPNWLARRFGDAPALSPQPGAGT